MVWESESPCIIALGLWNIETRFLKGHAFNMKQYSFDIAIYISSTLHLTWKGGLSRVNLHISSTLFVKTKTRIKRKQAGHWHCKGRKYWMQRDLRKSTSLDHRSMKQLMSIEDYGRSWDDKHTCVTEAYEVSTLVDMMCEIKDKWKGMGDMAIYYWMVRERGHLVV